MTVLVVDDDQDFRERLARALCDRGYDVVVAHDFDSAVAVAEAKGPKLAIIDLKLPGPSGLEVLKRLLADHVALRAVVLTGFANRVNAAEAVRLGAVGCLRKPADADEILVALSGPVSGPPSG